MLLRRMSGCLLTMALLLGTAWPAVCAACRPAIAAEECGAKHGGAMHARDNAARANPNCQDCGPQDRTAAKSAVQRHVDAAAAMPGSSSSVCSGASLQNARFEQHQRPTASPLLIVRILRVDEAGNPVDSRSSRPYSNKTFLENPVTLLRSVRLKI